VIYGTLKSSSLAILLLASGAAKATMTLEQGMLAPDCKSRGLLAATATNLRDNGASRVMALAVLRTGVPETDGAHRFIEQTVDDVLLRPELHMEAQRLYHWYQCASERAGLKRPALSVVAPQLTICQQLASPQVQVDCMSSVMLHSSSGE
jgi:hypothetical protein